jgi:cyclopropane fatty-acyl-phospholipid synthase-like methyltransferase
MDESEIKRQEKKQDFIRKSWLPYLKTEHIDKTMAIHFGHFEKGIRTYDEAILNKNDFIGRLLDLDSFAKSTATILDSGCGIGGTSIHLAKKYPNIKFIGVTNSRGQIFLANEFAKQNLVSSNTDFIVGDYLSISIIDNYFDGIFAIQSFARAKDNRKFLIEAHRLLKPNGKLIIDDIFLIKKPHTNFLKMAYKTYCKTWNLPCLEALEEFKSSLTEVGFNEIKILDSTKNVRMSFFILILKWFAFKLYVRKKETTKTEAKIKSNKPPATENKFIYLTKKVMLPLLFNSNHTIRYLTIVAVKKPI